MNRPGPLTTPSDRSPSRAIRVLWVTTKFPSPPVDGGRLLVSETLRALDPNDVEVTLAGPWLADRDRDANLRKSCPAVSTVLSGSSSGQGLQLLGRADALLGVGARPLTALKHQYPELRAQLGPLLEQSRFDVVHVEQPHALGCLPETRVPILLRAQNVEADLWRRFAASTSGFNRMALSRQALVVARWESQATKTASVVAAISEEDRQRFQRLCPHLGSDTLLHLPPAFPSTLHSIGRDQSPALSGDPAVVLFSGSPWQPNREGERAFFADAWPAMHKAEPDAVLHVFGDDHGDDRSGNHSGDAGGEAGTIRHPSPRDSAAALVEGAVLAVPATVTSGIRMKVLEAVARGMCVIATPAGARGLSPRLLAAISVAESPLDWAEQLTGLVDSRTRSARVRDGQAALRDEHNPSLVGSTLTSVYRRLAIHSAS